ncbi:maleylpyruvate isomerase family mycothiol-dependent enzyme [Kutzneria sp. CA-103260]|uniref:maleylpyruvate isomerase family mycothiol-dependent enzyme n=1 Tax=Kutzneria sp. CA-103260 TaxID=2802641 RepID=UPI001BA6B519|nr:maleylpyruvate isomerase family mycothiol-dependent enzyme [Kutzneria sp. CA-103260]QUQ68983.1 maleylpyruvate isomerase family mycothiol-dependent enzyme [Kutzneria sp. CA-103260]
MQTREWIAAVGGQGERLAAAAERAGLAAPVPTCPEWVVRDLLLHLGGVHRWAATFVGQARTEPIDIGEPHEIADAVPDDAGLVDWFRDGVTELVDVLTAAPADLDCWKFMRTAPSGSLFWARRQAHETTIHSVDAEAAAGLDSPIPSPLAVDGVDELLCGFLPRNRRLRADTETSVLVSATDTGDNWLIRYGPERPATARVPAPVKADTTLAGTASELYLALWNRRSWHGLSSDDGLATRWADNVQVRWS